MPSKELGLQESFRVLISSILVVSGLALGVVLFWQLKGYWLEQRTLGYAGRIVCFAQQGPELGEKYWKDFFSFWLLPQQPLRSCHLRALEMVLLETGYFKSLTLSCKDSSLSVSYRMSGILAQIEQGPLCLYETQKVCPALALADSQAIQLFGLEYGEEREERMEEVRSLLQQLCEDSLFQKASLYIQGWKTKRDPSSEMVLSFFSESGQKKWIRVGMVLFKRKERLGAKLHQVAQLMMEKKALWADLRIESALVLGYEKPVTSL